MEKIKVINKIIYFLLIGFFCACHFFANAQPPWKSQNQFRQTETVDTNAIRVMLKSGALQIYKPGENKIDLDSAASYLSQADVLLKQQSATDLELQYAFLLAELSFERKDQRLGIGLYNNLLKACQERKQDRWQAWALFNLAYRVKNNVKDEKQAAVYFDRALELYLRLDNIPRLKEILRNLINMSKSFEQREAAEKYAHQMLKAVGEEKNEDKLMAYETLADMSDYKGVYTKELQYGLQMIDCLMAIPNRSGTKNAFYFYRMAKIYQHLRMYDQSMVWLKKAYNEKSSFKPSFIVNITNLMLKQNKNEAALAFILGKRDSFKTASTLEKRIMSRIIADCYLALRNYPLAEKNYQEMLGFLPEHPDPLSSFDTFIPLAKFYMARNQFDKGGIYLEKLTAIKDFRIPLHWISDLQLLQYKIDSAKGNYLGAISHFSRYKDISDSLFNKEQSRQISELEIKYQTREKNRELNLQSQNIRLLKRQSQLQKAQLKSSERTRQLTVASSLLLLLLLAVAYSRFRVKRRLAAQLILSQSQLNEKNNDLERLVVDKDVLITEKEWLLKEIHHRVKNNLQIVTSLLSLQSAYLEDSKALNAIRESQHRMFAMSLIHNKLYQQESVVLIPMQSYIAELVAYLDEGLSAPGHIKFCLDIDAMELDASQAAPVGLLINEIVTNAVKHAFTLPLNNTISIKLKRYGRKLLLEVADNGRGLPENFKVQGSRSLGISLIHVFVKQLEGELSITNDPGLRMQISFPQDATSKIRATQKSSLKENIYE